jgi:hypothetical protein
VRGFGDFLEVTVDGDEDLLRDLNKIVRRLSTLEVVAPAIFNVLERAEQRLFDWWGGKYVRTGTTMASLTQAHGAMGVREVHPDTFTFGTRVDYAPYLREESGRSAVLINIRPSNIAEIHAVILEFLMRDIGGGGALGRFRGSAGSLSRRGRR